MDAESELERRASAGDADAQFALGSGLLASAESTDAFARGGALVEGAAANGHAEAACMVATMEAIGAGRRQDWQRAFDWLELAAARGSESAHTQLRLLAAGWEDVDASPGELRARIDVGRLLRFPERIAVSETPRIRVFEGFASPAECRWVIEALRPRLGPAMVWDAATGLGRIDPTRSNSAVELDSRRWTS